MWYVCMEQIVSQKVLLPIVPWFLHKYKRWTVRYAAVQHLYMGRSPPMFTDIRVLRQSCDDDHLALELGMKFLTADDMSAILAVKHKKMVGLGMWAKLHITGMHVEGKPLVAHGLDVTELPGIAGWLDKLQAIAFVQTLVEPNMLVVDVEKFASPGLGELSEQISQGTARILTPSAQATPQSSGQHIESQHEAMDYMNTELVVDKSVEVSPKKTKDFDRMDKFLPPPPKTKCSDELQERRNS